MPQISHLEFITSVRSLCSSFKHFACACRVGSARREGKRKFTLSISSWWFLRRQYLEKFVLPAPLCILQIICAWHEIIGDRKSASFRPSYSEWLPVRALSSRLRKLRGRHNFGTRNDWRKRLAASAIAVRGQCGGIPVHTQDVVRSVWLADKFQRAQGSWFVRSSESSQQKALEGVFKIWR